MDANMSLLVVLAFLILGTDIVILFVIASLADQIDSIIERIKDFSHKSP